MKEFSKEILNVDSWMMVTKVYQNPFAKIMITPRMLKNPRLDLDLKSVFIVGKIVGERKTRFVKITLSTIAKMKGMIIYLLDGRVIRLNDPIKEYRELLLAEKENIPIIYNWIIGSEYILSGNMYKEDNILYYKGRIISQDNEKNTVTLEDGNVAYIVWNSINLIQKIYISNLGENYIFNEEYCGEECKTNIFSNKYMQCLNIDKAKDYGICNPENVILLKEEELL